MIKEHEYKSIKECRDRCVCKKPRPAYKKKEFLDVIMSFEKDSQMHFEIKVPHKLSEEEFIGFLLGVLDKKNLLDLAKISLCLYYCEGVHCYDYILQTGGKYYFNVYLNDDPHTHKWNNFRNKLVETGNIPSKTSTNAVIKHKKRTIHAEEISSANHEKPEPLNQEHKFLEKLAALCETDYFNVLYHFNKGSNMRLYLNITQDIGEEALVKFLLSVLSKTKLKTLNHISLRFVKKTKSYNYAFLPKHAEKVYYFDSTVFDDADIKIWCGIRKTMLSSYISPEKDYLDKTIIIDLYATIGNIEAAEEINKGIMETIITHLKI
jgi:hypothetical protein